MPQDSTTDHVSTHIDEVGIRSIQTRWHNFLRTQNDGAGGTVLVKRFLKLRLRNEKCAFTEFLAIANEAVSDSDDASENAASRSDDSDESDD